jgi:hypothetical protein
MVIGARGFYVLGSLIFVEHPSVRFRNYYFHSPKRTGLGETDICSDLKADRIANTCSPRHPPGAPLALSCRAFR